MNYKNNIKSIAIGSFDGIHLGHKALIEQVEAVVIIERNGGYLTPGYKRSWYIEKPCFFYHFEHIFRLSAKEFIEKLENDFPKLETIVVGYDFEFGYKKEGSVELIQELFRGSVQIIDEVKKDNLSVHSRVIKSYLQQRSIEEVNRLLGRNFRINGNVVVGQGLGKKELVPTINLNVYDYKLPKNGVYATRTEVNGEWFNSISFLGHRVTTDNHFAVETHILNRDIGEVNGEVVVEFVASIRENRKFDSLEALKAQIVLDMICANKILK